eukprot:4519078-Pyramimonas_sp.AAC.1
MPGPGRWWVIRRRAGNTSGGPKLRTLRRDHTGNLRLKNTSDWDAQRHITVLYVLLGGARPTRTYSTPIL